MRHLFIVNPAAGKGVSQKQLIKELCARGLEHYITKQPGDAEEYVKKANAGGGCGAVRFYACGGDGTLNEIVNGAAGCRNAEVAFVPMGSGNDFIKSFDIPAECFLDIGRQLSGKPLPVDLIKYSEAASGTEARYAVNMANIGFDCNVAANMARFKKMPLVSGPVAYILAILLTVVRKEGAVLEIVFDDGTAYNGGVLFAAIGNGAYCGGGLKGVPDAKVDDGLMDVCIVKDVARRTIISLISKYADGTYVDEERLKRFIIYKKCSRMTVKNNSPVKRMGVDGEMKPSEEASFEITPGAMMFSIPCRF
jgi:YegS/Rv2252/BmrU family lipid kinase